MDKQNVIRITENRRVVRDSIPIEGEVLIARKQMQGWLRFREFIGRVDGFKTLGMFPDRNRFMVVDDRDAYPVSPYRSVKAIMDRQCNADGDDEMADRQGNYQLAKQSAESKAQWYYSSMAIAIMGIVFITVVLIGLFATGKIQLGVQ